MAMNLLATISLHASLLLSVTAREQPGQVVTDTLEVRSTLKCGGTAQACTCQRFGPEPQPVYTLNLTLRLPAPSENGSAAPVILFFHGLGGKYVLHTGDYAPYADAATDAGFAFLEYDVQSGGGFMEVLVDAIEVQFLSKILEWLKGVNKLPGTPAEGKLDANRIAVAGHSRGGKLAALHFGSGEKSIFGAFLVDPVDCTCFAPCSSACFPSALEAVAAAGRVIGVSGALVKGCCNPTPTSCGKLCEVGCYAATGNGTCTGNDFEDFLYAGKGGSQGYSQAAGHMQFAVPTSTVVQTLGNVFCGADRSTTNQEVSSQGADHMITWLSSQLPGQLWFSP